MIIIVIYMRILINMSFPLLGNGLALPSLGVFGPSFSWVGVGLLSRGDGWLISGLKLGLALPPWGWGCPALCGFFTHDFRNNHTMIIIFEGGRKQNWDWPLGFGSAIGLGLALLRVGVGPLGQR